MSKKFIAEHTLPIYEELLKKGKKDSFERFKKRCILERAGGGVCYLFYRRFGLDITKDRNVKKHIAYSCDGSKIGIIKFWWKVVYYAKTKKEAVECIQKRIDILKTWL